MSWGFRPWRQAPIAVTTNASSAIADPAGSRLRGPTSGPLHLPAKGAEHPLVACFWTQPLRALGANAIVCFESASRHLGIAVEEMIRQGWPLLPGRPAYSANPQMLSTSSDTASTFSI